MTRAKAFWPTAVVGEADHVNSVSASACHIGGPKGVTPRYVFVKNTFSTLILDCGKANRSSIIGVD